MKTQVIAVGVVAHMMIAAAAVITTASVAARSDRVEVEKVGGAAMPSDLELTTHRFQKTFSVQTVVADNADYSRQIMRIREHLADEVDAFRRGDFRDPETIHGADMPAVATLESRSDLLRVDLLDRPDGVSIVFRTRDQAVRQALHTWFDTQVHDRGAHAEHPCQALAAVYPLGRYGNAESWDKARCASV